MEHEIFGTLKDPQFAENLKSADQSDIQLMLSVQTSFFHLLIHGHYLNNNQNNSIERSKLESVRKPYRFDTFYTVEALQIHAFREPP